MPGINKVILVGNVGKDPDVRALNNGDKVANITLATSESWKDKSTGERAERTEWHNVSAFGGIAGVIDSYVRKGSRLYIEGQLQTRKWQDRDGNDRYTTEVVLRGPGAKLEMLDGKGGGNSEPRPQQAAPKPRKDFSTDTLDDEIPF